MHHKAIGKQDSYIQQLALLKAIAFLLLLLTFPLSNLQAQDYELTTFYKVKLKDRSNFIAELVNESKDSLFFKIPNGVTADLHRSEVRYFYKIQPGEVKNGTYYSDLFNYDKGFLNPHAFGPKRGEVYFENSMLIWNELNAGLTDHLSIRVGFDNFGIAQRAFEDFNSEYYEPVILIAPKISFPVIEERWYFAVTPAIINFPDDDGFFDYGVLFVSNSFGNKNKNFTIGTGAQLFGGNGAFENIYLTIAGNLRISPRVALTTENWIIPNRGYNDRGYDDIFQINSLGIKILGNHLNWSMTLTRARQWDDDFVSHIPFAGVALPISRGGGWKN